MESLKLRLTGACPLLMNAPTTINPLTPMSKAIKEITSKKKKTDSDQEELFRLKFEAALYIDANGPYVPGNWIAACGKAAAKKTRDGVVWSESVIVREHRVPLKYDGPRTIEGLYSNQKFVHVTNGRLGTSRIPVIRPIFEDWQIDINLEVDDEIMNPRQVLLIMHTAGRRIGIGTWREQFGKFKLDLLEATSDVSQICDQLEIPMLDKRWRKS